MATLVNVHGTYAHLNDDLTPNRDDTKGDLWWQPGSAFERTLTASVTGIDAQGQTSPLRVERLIWSGDNSEAERRAASARLLTRLLELEAEGENYCVVAHSHGGSVVSSALLLAASRNLELPGLKRWITAGTPFIGMRPIPLFVERLNLVQRVVLVASMMLLMMFLFYLAGQMIDPSTASDRPFGLAPGKVIAWRTLIAAVMMSVPAVAVTLVFRYFDRQQLFFYRKSTIARARAYFGARWLSLCHANDEAVQGLKSLPAARIQLFDPAFAVRRLTLIAVFALPLAYLTILASPSLMLSIAGVLKNSVYHVDKYAPIEKAFDAERKVMRDAVKRMQQAAVPVPGLVADPVWADVQKKREDLKQHYPDYIAIERALRFKGEFLQRDGKPCPGATLCGGGRDFATNSRLLFHVVTDDLTSALINDDTRFGSYTAAARVAVPMVLVPVASTTLALLFTLLLAWVARHLSAVMATLLNRVTVSEIQREIYGNDTGGEIAYGAGPRPAWMDSGRPYLPDGIAQLLTEHADRAASASLAKFRNAISTIAMSSGRAPATGLVSDYLTWKELIHSTYFDLPEFQLLVARAVASQEGFRPAPALLRHPGLAQVEQWVHDVDTTPAATGPPMALALAAE